MQCGSYFQEVYNLEGTNLSSIQPTKTECSCATKEVKRVFWELWLQMGSWLMSRALSYHQNV
jgi:hypothetical protein